jgi:exopolysaccharide production protein ExoQ
MSSATSTLDLIPGATRSHPLLAYAKTYVVIFVLFLYIQGNGIFSNGTEGVLGGTETAQNGTLALLNALLWVVSACVVLPKLQDVIRVLLQNHCLALFMVLAPISSIWSQVSLISLRRSVILDVSILFAIWFLKAYNTEEQQKIILATGVFTALASAAMAILLPQFGIMGSGEWKGVFWHKNQLAQAMELLFSPLFFYRFQSRFQALGGIAVGLLGLTVMLLSQARTGLLLTLAIAAVAVFARLAHRLENRSRPFLYYSAVFITFVGLPLLLLNADTILVLLGKDPNFTGRLDTWPLLIPFTLQHPLLGYGYSGFWTGYSGDSGTALSGMHGYMNTADNGYIDMALQFGLTGFVLLIALLFSALRDFANIAKRREVPLVAFWYLSLVLDAIFSNFSGTFFFEANGIATITLVVGCVGLNHLRRSFSLKAVTVV